MRFLCTGDWHIDANRPERRIDDYWETVQKKLGFIMDLYKKEDCLLILQPGDFFNSHKANDYIKQWTISLLRKQSEYGDATIIGTVFGQHDLRYHSSDTENTPLAVLNASGEVTVLRNLPLVYPQDRVYIYGAHWYEDIPKPLEELKGLNILVIHRMIIKNEKVWDGQEDATMGNILLKTAGFDLIVSGDNHQSFTISDGKGKHLINCGSLLRTKIDQINHIPIVYIYDTDNKSVTPHEVPIQPFTKVFDMAKYEEEKKRDEKLEAFVERMNQKVELEDMDFIVNIKNYVKENKEEIDDITLGVIEEIMA